MAKAKTMSAERALLLRVLDDSYNNTAWHGPNLKGSVRRVKPAEALWRPRPGRHNIAEIVLHCAYWKYAVRRRILGLKRGSFPVKGSNWFSVSGKLSAEQWRSYLALLDEQHAALREAIATAPTSQLANGRSPGKQPASHVYGIALHDCYHAGQVRTLKTLYQQASSGGGKQSRKKARK